MRIYSYLNIWRLKMHIPVKKLKFILATLDFLSQIIVFGISG